MSAIVASLLLPLIAAGPAAEPGPPCEGAASLTRALSNPRLPLGRLRTLPPGVLCPPPATFAAPAVQTAPPQAVTVVVVRELIVRPSEVIIDPPEIHFVDPPTAEAPPPETTPAPNPASYTSSASRPAR